MYPWHLVTCEYPPQIGGVSDHTFAIASALAETREVHVWGAGIRDQGSGARDQGSGSEGPQGSRVMVHADLGTFRVRDLARVSRGLNEFPKPRQLLVQWVPHGYGWRALNVPFALWVAMRALAGDRIDLLVHEPYIDMSTRPAWLAAALVQRAMLIVAAAAARRIWVSTPSWIPAVRPYATGRQAIRWLPVPASVLPVQDARGVADVRRRISPDGRPIVGHFGSYSRLITDLLEPALRFLAERTDARVLLVGRGGEDVRTRLASAAPSLAHRFWATGALENTAVSRHLQACDVMLQPYPDGISARRTTAVALLAHGLPTVTNHGRLSEAFWKESDAVALVDSPAAEGLSERVGTLLGDEVGRARLATAARDLHDRVFAVRHAVTRLDDAEPMSGDVRAQDSPLDARGCS